VSSNWIVEIMIVSLFYLTVCVDNQTLWQLWYSISHELSW